MTESSDTDNTCIDSLKRTRWTQLEVVDIEPDVVEWERKHFHGHRVFRVYQKMIDLRTQGRFATDYSVGELVVDMVLGIADIAPVEFEEQMVNTVLVVGMMEAVGLVADMLVDMVLGIAEVAPVEFAGQRVNTQPVVDMMETVAVVADMVIDMLAVDTVFPVADRFGILRPPAVETIAAAPQQVVGLVAMVGKIADPEERTGQEEGSRTCYDTVWATGLRTP